MTIRSLAAIFGCAALGACAQGSAPATTAASAPITTPPPVSAPAAASTQTAARGNCRTSRSFDDSGFHIKMTMKKNAGACSVTTSFRTAGRNSSGDLRYGSSGSIESPPQHGTAEQTFDVAASAVIYTPAPGYVGPDHFTMRVLPSSRDWEVAVTVTP